MLTESVKKSIESSVLCWLATANEIGEPNVSPKEMFIVYSNECLLIANIASPHSARNVEVNSAVCVSFVDVFKQKGYKLKGVAELIKADAPDFTTYLAKFDVMDGSNYPIKSIFMIKVTSVNPIVAPSYWLFPQTTTENGQIEQALKAYGVKLRD